MQMRDLRVKLALELNGVRCDEFAWHDRARVLSAVTSIAFRVSPGWLHWCHYSRVNEPSADEPHFLY